MSYQSLIGLPSSQRFVCLSVAIIALTVIFLRCTNSYAADLKQENTLSLQEALSIALKNNPDIAVATREREAILGVSTQAATRLNPAISTSIQDTRSDTRQITMQLSQEIELGNKRQARMNAAAAFMNKSTAAIAQKKLDIHAEFK